MKQSTIMRELLNKLICLLKGHEPVSAYAPGRNGARRIVMCYRCREKL